MQIASYTSCESSGGTNLASAFFYFYAVKTSSSKQKPPSAFIKKKKQILKKKNNPTSQTRRKRKKKNPSHSSDPLWSEHYVIKKAAATRSMEHWFGHNGPTIQFNDAIASIFFVCARVHVLIKSLRSLQWLCSAFPILFALTASLARDMKPMRLFHTRLMSFRSCCSFSEHTAVALMPSSTRRVTRYTSTTPDGREKAGQ